jgi:hypothetical protein
VTTILDSLPPGERERFEDLVLSHGAEWVRENWVRLKDEAEWLTYSAEPGK